MLIQVGISIAKDKSFFQILTNVFVIFLKNYFSDVPTPDRIELGNRYF